MTPITTISFRPRTPSPRPAGRSMAYACATRVNGGTSACDNTIRVPRHVAEYRLLAGLRDELTAPERFEQLKREARRLLDAERRSLRNQDRDRGSRLAQLDSEIANITEAVGPGAADARSVGAVPSGRGPNGNGPATGSSRAVGSEMW